MAEGEISTPQERAHEIHDLIADSSVDVLLGAWGGKTSNELLQIIDFRLLKARAKPIIGFSDVGVICNASHLRAEMPAAYGPNILGKLEESDHGDLSVLRSSLPAGSDPFRSSGSGNTLWVGNGAGEGKLLGGNLGTFVLGIATWREIAIRTETILFFESTCNEERVARQHLAALDNSGILAQTRAIVFGALGFATNQRRIESFVHSIHDRLDIPIAYVPTFGHGRRVNPPIPIGIGCHLDPRKRLLQLTEAWTPL